MPAQSEAQRRLFAAAAHGAQFEKAKKLRETVPPATLRDFSQVAPQIRTRERNYGQIQGGMRVPAKITGARG